MLLLAIDTSAIASAALLRHRGRGGAEVLASFASRETNTHSEVLAPAVEGILREAGVAGGDLDRIVVGVGPGPFTGLRVGIATARMLGFAWGVPVDGMMSLDAVAADVLLRGTPGPGEFTVATDARRREVYWARYDAAGALVDGPRVGPAEDVPAGPVCGAGAGLYAKRLLAVGADPLEAFAGAQPTATALGRAAADALAAGREFLPTVPLYLRESDAQVPRQMSGPRA